MKSIRFFGAKLLKYLSKGMALVAITFVMHP